MCELSHAAFNPCAS